MTDPETPDDAYERLLRETRLGEQIGEWEEILAQTQVSPPKLGYLLSGTELMLLIGQLRELRARRIAAGREPDDELNAPADMCCCHDWPRAPDYEPDPQFAEGCPLHPRTGLGDAGQFDAGASLRSRPPGWRPNPDFVPRPEPKTAGR